MSERQEMIGHADRGARASRPTEANARDWVKALAPYREPRLGRSLAELAVTTVPFVALWVAMLLSLRYSYWLCLLLAVPGSGFVVRLFMIQHDCGHGSFFRRRRANDWLGRVIGVLTLRPMATGGARTPCTTPPPAIWTGGARATSTR